MFRANEKISLGPFRFGFCHTLVSETLKFKLRQKDEQENYHHRDGDEPSFQLVGYLKNAKIYCFLDSTNM